MRNATFLLRFKAFMFDYILIFAYLSLLVVVNIFIFPSLQSWFNSSLYIAQFAGFLMVTLPISLYFIICDSVIGKQSYGKRKVGIKVVTNQGDSPSVILSIVRVGLKFLPWELSHFLVYRLASIGDTGVPLVYTSIGAIIYILMFAYILTAIFTSKKQSIYDLITKTQVIYESKK
jgi:uncharacterized RDD family membrane protein YckC